MQSEFVFMGPSPLEEVHSRLLKAHVERHGPLGKWVQFDPVTQLVLAILDGRTREDISKRAFSKLRRQFRNWDDVRHASSGEVFQLIQPVTFAERKAVYIREALNQIHNCCGGLNLGFLSRYGVGEARSWLETLPGVGPKVSAAVVNFSTLHMPALVINSHYQRIAKRLRLVTSKASDREIDRSLSRLVPRWMTVDDLQQHYFVVKRHGQTTCRTYASSCRACALRDICLTGKKCGAF